MTGNGGRPAPRPVHEQIEAHARRAPTALALVTPETSLTYGDLDDAANRLAWRLRDRATGREAPVAVCLPRSPGLLVALLAIAKSGCCAVLLDPEWPDHLLNRVLASAAPEGVITDAERRGPWSSASGWLLGPGAGAGEPVPPSRAGSPALEVPLDGLAYRVHTSGSTGRPKSVGVTHRALAHRAATHRAAYRIQPASRSAWLTSPGSSMSSVELWPNLTAGASIHLPGAGVAASPTELRDWLVATRITNAFIPMPVGEALFGLEWPGGSALRLITVGGDSVRRWPAAALPFEVAVEYGSAEANAVCSGLAPPGRCTSITVGPAGRGTRPPIGRPWPDVVAEVLDERLRPVPDGELGELCVGGPELARGYLGDPALTAERFVPDPRRPGSRLFRTGDLARRDSAGLLHHHGRADAQEKILGYRVEPAEVEAVLLRHPGVTGAIVTGRTDPHGDRRLVGYLIGRPGLELRELRGFARARLPAHMVPTVFVLVPGFPLTTGRKVDRRSLPDPAWPGLAEPGLPARPTRGDAVLADVLDLWSRELDGHTASAETDFRDAGGDSLHATRLLRRIGERFGVQVKLRDFFRDPTPAALARRIHAVHDSRDG